MKVLQLDLQTKYLGNTEIIFGDTKEMKEEESFRQAVFG